MLAKIDRRKAAGKAKGAVSRHRRKDYDDVTLARKVETELFRPADVPKGAISVNVNDGVVELRGELPDQGQIDELGDTARKIDGVKDVRNLLHTGARTAADRQAGIPRGGVASVKACSATPPSPAPSPPSASARSARRPATRGSAASAAS